MCSLKRSNVLLTCLVAASCAAPSAENEPAVHVMSLREQAETFFDLNVKRVDRLMLPAMRSAGIDCWIMMSREGFIDPVLEYIRDENGEGGHRNAFIFFDDGSERLRRIVIGTHLPRETRVFDQVLGYPSDYGEEGPSLQPALRRIVHELQPTRIGVNQSRTIGTSDGLTVEMKKHLVDAIGPEYARRIVSAEQLSVDFLDTRLPEEFALFEEAAAITQMLHEEVLSDRLILPGVTTVDELKWYLYDRMMELRVVTWFPVGLSVIRQGERVSGDSTVIQPGDLLKTDIGIVYAGLYTDYQRAGYVLKPGETAAPAGLQAALDNALKVQDAVAEVARPGVPGYVVKAEAETLCESQGVEARVASHSVDAFGHGVGSWFSSDWPDRYSDRARFPVRDSAYYALESSATTEVPEWNNQRLSFGTEESVYATPDGLKYFIPRQEKLYLIMSQ